MTNEHSDLIIGIAGSGGDGVISAGDILMHAAAVSGYHAIATKSFGSQIRGGEASCRVRISTGELHSAAGALDVAVVFSWADFLQFGAELPVDGRTVVIYDRASGVKPDRLPLVGVVPAAVIDAPIGELAKQSAGTDGVRNIVSLGMLAGWFGLPVDAVRGGISAKLAKKGPEVLDRNCRAFDEGLEYARRNPLLEARTLTALRPGSASKKMLVDGNDMCAAAALFAGCEFFSGYPITPSSEIMHFLNREIWKYGGVLLQAEDEIAGAAAVVGASFAGKKALTATSGPGMSLKTEVLGLATIAELPLVCVNVQRGGPSTGIPTKSEQADLFQAVFSGHGDAPRPVIAPTNVADTFACTVEAFNIAEQYQTPVILLSDQDIAQRKETVDPIDTSKFTLVNRRAPTDTELQAYARFRLTESGISPISAPGQDGGNYLASGIEHNEHGAPTASGEIHARMNEKRFRKLEPLKLRRDLFTQHGPDDAPIGVVSWGSVAGVAREAVSEALGRGLKVKLLVPRLLYPVAEPVYQDFFASVRRGLVVEQSYQGQLFRLLRMYVDLPDVQVLARSGANPISAGEVGARLGELVALLQRAANNLEPTLG